ncbi:ABC transporter permease [Gracilibacillus phocaeensis]|uniref:ABC transporter permease n=1 Tax=Gracilibacillus phocaeensis TaxID=2042304 RepID=UPI00103007ED|nr:ABC transporter permease [Gracilibacillus phocaeensis]
MMKLIKNEWIKMKSEKVTLVIVALSLLPLLMNLANFFFNNGDTSLQNGFYFTYYNQYFMLLPIIMSVLISYVFYIEYKNKTYLDWITYPESRVKLLFSKIAVAGLMIFAIYLLQLVILLLFYAIVDGDWGNMWLLTSSYTVLNVIVVLTILLGFAVIIQWTQHLVASISIGIGVSLLSMIFMAAPFSYLIPPAFGYRLGLVMIDPTYYYENVVSSTIIGIGLLMVLMIGMLLLNVKLVYRKNL